MKFIKPLLFFFLALSIISCGDDPESIIEGTWSLESLDYSGSTTAVFPGGSLLQTFTGVGENISAKISFDQETFTSSGSYDIDLTTVSDGTSTQSTVPINGFLDNGTYVYDGTIMTVTNSSGTQEVLISELSDNRMVMEIDTELITNQGGVSSTTIVNVDYILIR